MKRSFYHYVMKYREPEPNSRESELANSMYDDLDFPKMSEDYHELSNYIELTEIYFDKISIFDDLWEEYRINIKQELI
ncbi:YozE family protein [Jeotgalibacillus sp. S-D1]|uniref:YozE family protein n=1 Tax=Jeotgalibacillus sp. S-D1 TaxID=2552189 RepID=UPI0010595E04|nr:YozE family protein [Jeotgalibacillus sp. S-D1]TDL34809.1 YozE family protein [Jeotgalibacillus sp. S-D1]